MVQEVDHVFLGEIAQISLEFPKFTSRLPLFHKGHVHHPQYHHLPFTMNYFQDCQMLRELINAAVEKQGII
jgi:hypothetical protein